QCQTATRPCGSAREASPNRGSRKPRVGRWLAGPATVQGLEFKRVYILGLDGESSLPSRGQAGRAYPCKSGRTASLSGGRDSNPRGARPLNGFRDRQVLGCEGIATLPAYLGRHTKEEGNAPR